MTQNESRWETMISVHSLSSGSVSVGDVVRFSGFSRPYLITRRESDDLFAIRPLRRWERAWLFLRGIWRGMVDIWRHFP